MLAAAGVSPRVAMELMRHSDMKLTMGVYTDVAQLPIIEESALLPSLQIPPKRAQTSDSSLVADAQGDAQRSALTGVLSGHQLSLDDILRQEKGNSNPLENHILGHEKAPRVTPRRFPEMERAKRLERDETNSQLAAAQYACESTQAPGALGDAPEDNSSERIAPARDPTGQAAHDGDASLQEVIARWSALNPTLKAAILAIARVPDLHPA